MTLESRIHALELRCHRQRRQEDADELARRCREGVKLHQETGELPADPKARQYVGIVAEVLAMFDAEHEMAEALEKDDQEAKQLAKEIDQPTKRAIS